MTWEMEAPTEPFRGMTQNAQTVIVLCQRDNLL